MGEWFEDFGQDMWLGRDEDNAEEEADLVRRLLRLRPGDSVLDVPCGAGRIALPLARRGCRVTGVDLTPEFIERVRERFALEGLDGVFEAKDMRQIDFPPRFDGVFNWRGSFGYFSDRETLDVLRRMAAAVKPGGRLLIDQPHREYLLRHFIHESKAENMTIKNRWDGATQRVESDWTIEREGGRETSHLSIRLYSVKQFRAMFERSGLRFVGAMDREGNAFRRASKRVVVVGEKPA